MNPVMGRRIENAFQPAQFSNHFRVDKELIYKDERLDGYDHCRRKAYKAQWCPEKESEARIEYRRPDGCS